MDSQTKMPSRAGMLSTPAVAARPWRTKKNVARLDHGRAGRLFENEPPVRIDRLKDAFKGLRRPRHADPGADTGGEREPFGADRFETLASRPNFEPMRPSPPKAPRRRAPAATFCPRSPQGRLPYRAYPLDARRSSRQCRRRRRSAHPADWALSNKIPASLAPPWRTIVRPFDRKTPVPGKDFAQRMEGCDASGKAKFRQPGAAAPGSIRSRLA